MENWNAGLVKWRKRHVLLADAMIAIFAYVSVLGVIFSTSSPAEVGEVLRGSRGAMYGSLASIYGSLLGFVITAVSIVSVFGDLPRFHLLKDSGRLADIFTVFFSTITSLAIATVLSLTGMILDTDESPLAPLTFISVLVFSVVCVRMWRCIWIMKEMSAISVTPIGQTQNRPHAS